MSEDKKEYRQIMKATSLFGGVQALQIVIAIVRAKIIAVLLGPTGMGIAGLLTATISMVEQISSMSLKTSAVKDISGAHASGNSGRIATVISVFRKVVWATGLLGSVVVFVTAPYLSELAFGSGEYTWSFMLISVTLLFNQLATGQKVIMQGTRRLKLLASASLWGSFISLILTVPLYYVWGIGGIVPAIILTGIISFLISWHFSSKIELKKVPVSRLRILAESKGMIKLGFAISVSGLFTLAASYVVKIYISNTGGVAEVGLYNAGMAIVISYVGMIFSAMSKDYYPRLAGTSKSLEGMKKIVNQQAEIAVLILGPIIMGFLVFINWMIILIYTREFLAIEEMIHWAALGMLFKAAGWAMGFIILARGDSKIFFWNELAANAYTLALNIAGYYTLGLLGLGISYLAGYVLYMFQMLIFTRLKYNFSFNRGFMKIFSIQVTLAAICFTAVYTMEELHSYLVGSLFIVISAVIAFKELNKRLDLTSYIKNYRKNDNQS